ncbi:CoA ester lyase [Candidimonas humi]|uniref:HpcH/HpaI aldolase/citrate lyase family protein n=1 Tax=Candidimonas humi TaxID=683355 RepID=UPI001C3EA2B5|nr:CoA ester lyase [Candidimonas humi]MBV6307237.1 CoA ester lyase [Candidimonas humi]
MTGFPTTGRGRADLPAWRSILYVPANVPRYLAKAAEAGPDAVQLDLEDSIAPAEKERAREAVGQAARQLRAKGIDVSVRINQPLSLAVRDVEAVVGPDVGTIALTKVGGRSHVRLFDELVSECESRRQLALGHTRFIIAIETPEAFEDMLEIAKASPRAVAMILGAEDLALEWGCEPIEDVMRMPKQRLIAAARAAGILPLGMLGSITDFRDMEAFRAMVRRSRQFGFEGATCIHPSQVAVLNDEYMPSQEQLDSARNIVALDAEASAQGRGAFQVGGRMIDAPIVQRARRLLARAGRLQEGHGAA